MEDPMMDDIDKEDLKKKKIKRIILFSAIAVVIIAIIVVIILVTRKDSDDKPDEKKEETYTVLFNNSKINKPNHTQKEYQIIQLDKSKNIFILIKDPKTLNGAIEIRTNLGFHTEVIDGFAHYSEHIFFGGSQRVTELDLLNLVMEFNEWLNAYTWHEETVFQLFGSNYTYDTLLDYISECIKNPFLNLTYLLTEIDVVTSEYDNNNVTYNTYQDIYRANSNPKHPFGDTRTAHIGSKFTLGNHTAEDLKNNLQNYFRVLFNPENSVYLLYSSLSFEEMANKAKKYFNYVLEKPTKEFNDTINKKINALDEPLFLEGDLGKIAIFNHSRKTSKMLISYSISQKSSYVETMDIIGYLFNGYHEGSFQKFLYDNNYISNFVIYNDGHLKNYELVNFDFDLTIKGVENINKIIEAFFATINTIKDLGNLNDLIRNAKTIEENKFKNKEETPAVFPTDVDNIVLYYHYYGPQNMISGSPIEKLYTNERVNEIINELAPEKSFIFIDSNDNVNTPYITSNEILYEKDYNTPYRMNKIPEELLTNLKTIKKVDNYEFKIRELNSDYTTKFETTEKPCYEKVPNNCAEFKEYDINKPNEEYSPYIIKNETNILSLIKIDRSYGIPFVKGYIDLSLDKIKFKEYVNNTYDEALFYFILYSFNYKYYFSSLKEGGSTISLSEELNPNFAFTFSTYNDLLDKSIQYIIDFFKEPIDENTFKTFKERYYFQNVVNYDNPHVELRTDLLNYFKRFISVDTYAFKPYDDELINSLTYTDFKNLFNNLKNIIKNLKFLTHGDLSIEQATSNTDKLSSLIKFSLFQLSSNKETKVELPEGTSVFYSLISPNPYQRQGATLVMYEFDKKYLEQMTIYSYCASAMFWDYIRTKRGSGYAVKVQIHNILDNYYLFVYCLGKVYSPEYMDRLVNEAIEFSFNFKQCNVPQIRQHLKNKANIKGYAQDKFESLLKYLNPENDKLNNENIFQEDNMTYDTVIEDLKEVFIKKVKRTSILYHRGDISSEDLAKQKAELDGKYYLNNTIVNDVSENITYLEKYVKNN